MSRHCNIKHDSGSSLNTDQEFSVCEVNSELQSYFHYAAQNENMIYLTIIHVANIPG